METQTRVIQGEMQLPNGRLVVLKFPHRLDPFWVTDEDLDVLRENWALREPAQ